jgi:hypothetical protein
MSQVIEYARVLPKELLASGSRYMNQQVIYYGDQKFMTFDIYNKTAYVPTGNEKVMLITKGLEYRPDLVSYDAYGFVDNWWRILEANQMKDIWDFKTGKTIIVPNKIL